MRKLNEDAHVGFMTISSWLAGLEHVHTSYLLLGMLVVAVLAAGVLFRIGLVGWMLRCFADFVRASIRGGFRTWEYLLGWASWTEFVGIACALLLAGGILGGWVPVFRILCSVALMIMGSSACFAYMFIDFERTKSNGATRQSTIRSRGRLWPRV